MAKNRFASDVQKAILALADGSIFSGIAIGATGQAVGEVVFNTAMTGYQEILTDPSYAQQIVTLTYPHIGNVGVNHDDQESNTIWAKGLIIRDLSLLVSNWRSQESLVDYLIRHNIVAIAEIDTRKLTRLLRDKGAQSGCILTSEEDTEKALAAARAFPGIAGMDLAKEVSTKTSYQWDEPVYAIESNTNIYAHSNIDADAAKSQKAFSLTQSLAAQLTESPSVQATQLIRSAESLQSAQVNRSAQSAKPVKSTELTQSLQYHVVVFDFGVKQQILRLLVSHGCKVTVVPATTSVTEVIALNPDGVLLSNGPGDPAACDYAIHNIQQLLQKNIPILGICLGFQLLALACGAKTKKMKFGHHGANHPIQNTITKAVMITSQNHGFSVDEASLPASLQITYRSLFDGTLQGFQHKNKPVFAFQGHPESSPGPHDSISVFQDFIDLMRNYSE